MYPIDSHKKNNFSILTITFALFITISTATLANAETFTVTRTDDRNATCNSGVDCSLREAVNAANAVPSDDTINFAPSITIITLANEIVINNAGTMTINGNGANVLTIDGGPGTNRIFFIDKATVTISSVTLTGGNGAGTIGGNGGAIYAIGGTIVLNSIHVTANSANTAGGVYFNNGTDHQILNSTFSANTASSCGGFYNDTSTLAVTNSTISGNSVENIGGGFCSLANTTLRHVTITANSAGNGGGGMLINLAINFPNRRTLNLGNTIVAGNTGSSTPDIRFNGGTITTAGYNLLGDNSGIETIFPAGNPNANQDIVGTSASPVNPLLGPLQNNGGTTPTHALLLGSLAINVGNNAEAPVTDQRGFARIIGGTIDIGAFEYAPVKSRKRIRFF